MNRALAQNWIGSTQNTLNPSLRALGPNVYLGPRAFFAMVGLALLVHLTIIAAASLIKPPEVTDIPVRALSFKIGDNDRVAAIGAPVEMTPAAPVPLAPVANTNDAEWHAAPTPAKPQPRLKPVPMIPPEQRQMPVENRSVLPPLPTPKTVQITDTPSAIAPSPQHFIREVGAAPQLQPLPSGAVDGSVGGQGNITSNVGNSEQAIRARYEEQISAWIQLHKLYPMAAQGAEGRAVVRIRIDRGGFVRYYALDESSGNAVLDAAAIDMVRRANPVPAVPTNYPAGALIEFLIPITFKVPR